MRILLAVQGTGNGHISRAKEIIPHLKNYGQLDLAVSGTQADVTFGQEIKYKFHGFSFTFGTKGGVDRLETWKEMDLRLLMKDIRSFPLSRYDLIINDFEPVTAWACRIHRKQCIALSHQASFLSSKTPRPGNKGNWAEVILKQYAPSTHAIGFHFERYDTFINTPVIRSEIRNLEPSRNGHFTVYLPAYDDRTLITYLSQISEVRWDVFSKHSKTAFTTGNVQVIPVENKAFNLSLAACEGFLTGGGFEGPAEAMFLGKKVMSIPMTGQWEQQCNAEAMRRLGVLVIPVIKPGFQGQLREWVHSTGKVNIAFPNETEAIIAGLIAKYTKIG